MSPCRRLRYGVLVLLVALIAASLGASRVDAAPAVPYEGPSWMARLAMVGDSQTWTSVDTFRPALQADWWRPAIFSFPGVRTETMRDQVRAMAADRPDAFVVELGGMDTLDIISGARSWAFEQAQIDGTIADIRGAGVPCVVWVGPNQDFDSGAIGAWSTAINDEIRYRLAIRGAGVFADWTTVANGHPEYFVADGSHMTDAGKQAYVAMIKDSLQNCTRNPRGNLDVVSGGIGARVVGWSYDPDTNASIPVHVYVDGAFKGVLDANTSRPDVAAVLPGVGPNHGFDGSFAVGAGTHQVCAFAINAAPYGFTNPSIGCRSVTIDGSPTGYVDSVTGPSPGSVRAQGWAMDADVTWAIDVHVYVDGVFRAAATANASRPDLVAAFPAYGGGHGFDVTVGSVSPGGHQVCVYGINNVFTAGQNRLLGCRIVAVS